MPDDYAAYPHHSQVCEYFNAYVDLSNCETRWR